MFGLYVEVNDFGVGIRCNIGGLHGFLVVVRLGFMVVCGFEFWFVLFNFLGVGLS